jgi:hypothetical protein
MLALLHFRVFRYWDFDDAFIVYRIVRNLVDYGEWAFNTGERFNASTSVLNTLLVWGGSYLAGSIPASAHAIGAVSIFLTSLLCFELFKKDFEWDLSLLLAAFVSWTLAHNSTWGLEGYLFICLLFLFVYLESATIDSWVCLGFLALARPDGVVVATTRWFTGLIAWRTLSLPGLCRFGVVLLPWVAFSLATFGQLFPETLSNKMWQGRSGLWGSGWIYFAALKAHLIHLPKTLLVLFVAAPLGAIALLKAKSPLGYLWSFVAIQQAVYSILNVPGYHWYFATLDIVGAVTGFYGLLALTRFFWRGPVAVSLPGAWRQWSAAALSIAGLGCYAFSTLGQQVQDGRTEAYREFVRKVDKESPSTGSLAAVEVGTFAFYTNRPMVDMVGLATDNPEFITGANNDRFFERPAEGIIVHSPPWPHERSILDDIRAHFVYTKAIESPHPVLPLAYYVKTGPAPPPDAIDEYVRKNFVPFRPSPAPRMLAGEIVCALDQVNGQLAHPSRTLSVNQAFLRAHGWSVDTKWNQPGEDLHFLLLASNGQAFLAPAARTERRDVGAVFPNLPDLRVGFESVSSLVDVPGGIYAPGIAIMRDGELVGCPFNANVRIGDRPQ